MSNVSRSSFSSWRGEDRTSFSGRKSDFRSEKLVLVSPRQAEKQERLTFETCYFRGLEDLDTIRTEMLEDALNSETSALAVLRDIRSTPLGLAGTEK